MYRQGDILLVPTTQLPEDLKQVDLELGKHILAHGEVTGHHHAFDGNAPVALMEAPTGERYLTVESTSPLTHQEHSTIDVEPGSYVVVRQREYNDEEEWNYVRD